MENEKEEKAEVPFGRMVPGVQATLRTDDERLEYWHTVAELASRVAAGSTGGVTGNWTPDAIAKRSVDIAVAIFDEIASRANPPAPPFKVGDRVRLRGTDAEGEVVDVGDPDDDGVKTVRVKGIAQGAADLSWYPLEYLELVTSP